MQAKSYAPSRAFIFTCSFFALVLTLLVSWPAFAVDNTNLPGRDYASFPAPSASVCRNTCGGESRCQAYTWVKPGIQGPSGMCWLKHSEPEIVRDSCCDSGPRRFIEKSNLRAEDKMDRPGSDYRRTEMDGWQNCQASCEADGICASWAYARRGVQGPTGVCWLKNVVARPVPNNGTVSGVKFKRASVIID